jgi:hypothetical protein
VGRQETQEEGEGQVQVVEGQQEVERHHHCQQRSQPKKNWEREKRSERRE